MNGCCEQPRIMQTQPENEIFSNRRIAKNTLVLYVRMIFMTLLGLSSSILSSSARTFIITSLALS